AMDGAMKFVKGDAIAGLIIVLINAVGGLIIGVMFKGMSAGEAAKIYTLLAIGDGLVSQIPALCIAISAGLVVTRVASETETASLGGDIGSQFVSHPKAVGIVAALLALLGLMPMMPKVPFFALALGAGLGARWLARRRASEEDRARQAALEPPSPNAPAAPKPEATPAPAQPAAPAIGVAPICLDLDASLEPMARAEQNRFITKDLPMLREMLFHETGVRFPGIRARGGASLGEGGYMILIDEVPSSRGTVDPEGFIAANAPDELAALDIPVTPFEDPATGQLLSRIPASAVAAVREMGVPVRAAHEQVLFHLATTLKRHASSFLGIQEVQSLLDALEKTHPALVREATEKVATPLLTEVLRRLVEEGVSIRNLRVILEALSEPDAEGDSLALSERCRRALRRHLSHRYAEGGTLYAHLADPELEELLRGAIRASGDSSALALAPDEAVAILDGVRGALGDTTEGVILTSPDVRRYLRKLCEGSFPNLAVLTYSELSPDLQIRPVGKVCAWRQAA
ncbi:MAG: FHIPEP family type III secretion protein, partial [Myxococcales bacterium]